MRKPLIAANWKMFLKAEEAKELAKAIGGHGTDYSKVDVMLAPSYVYLSTVSDVVRSAGGQIKVAAQNIYYESEGAFTGEVSTGMVQSLGVSAVILGHSERRHIFGETDSLINKKVHKVISENMIAVLCVGEQLEEREAGVAVEVVLAQLGNSLLGVKDLDRVVIAYEPVWAIGTGKTASPQDAQAMHKEIRAFLSKMYGDKAGMETRILYGGSVKPENIKELMAQADVDGALVGGASLKADQFIKIIQGGYQ